jgi:hypothetical protein
MTKGQKKKRRQKWLAMCAGKVKHKSMVSAELVLKINSNKDQVIYECEFCKDYHIGKLLYNIKK